MGEAPGFHEDREGTPFAGRARELLERLLGGVGLSLDEVYLATVLKCRPPGNRDPLPEESAACEPYLYRQLDLVRPRVVATLGSFATALLSGRALGITRVHGQEQDVTLGGRRVTLYPLYHPAAALYTPTMLDVLERDVARLPRAAWPAERQGVSIRHTLACRSPSSRRPHRRAPRAGSGSRCSSGCSEWRPSRSRAARPRRPRRSRPGSPALSRPVTSSSSRASSARARRRSSGGPAARSASRDVSRARRSRSATATAGRSTSPISTSTAFAASRRRSGAISSRTSRTRSCSSSGRRPGPVFCRQPRAHVRLEHVAPDVRRILVDTADRTLLEESTGARPGLRHRD